MSDTEYRFTARPLSEDEAGGYLIEFPDLPCCISDGETIKEVIANGKDPKRCWIAAMREAGRPIPPPAVEAVESYSGKWHLRAPKSLHRRLAERGKREGVSLNALAVTMLAESLGERATRERRGVFESKGISRVDIDINESDPVYSLAGQLIGLQLARCVPNRRITAPSIQ